MRTAIGAFQSDAEFLDVGTPATTSTLSPPSPPRGPPFDVGRWLHDRVRPRPSADSVLWDRVVVGGRRSAHQLHRDRWRPCPRARDSSGARWSPATPDSWCRVLAAGASATGAAHRCTAHRATSVAFSAPVAPVESPCDSIRRRASSSISTSSSSPRSSRRCCRSPATRRTGAISACCCATARDRSCSRCTPAPSSSTRCRLSRWRG